MLFGKQTVKQVLVELVDVRPHRPVVQLHNTPITSLPENLEAGIQASFGKIEFEIIEALPSTRELIADMGYVRLIVRYATQDNDEDVEAAHIYNTVCGNLPPFDSDAMKIGRQPYQVPEPDWRQVEFVSRSLSSKIDESLSFVRSIIENHEVDGGYDACFVRDLIPYPLSGAEIGYEALLSVFEDIGEARDGVALQGHANMVAGGFAFRTASLTEVYGYITNSIVQAFCIGGIGAYEYDSQELQSIADFCAEYDLCLVDWTSARVFHPETEEFFAYFDPPNNLDEVYQDAPL